MWLQGGLKKLGSTTSAPWANLRGAVGAEPRRGKTAAAAATFRVGAAGHGDADLSLCLIQPEISEAVALASEEKRSGWSEIDIPVHVLCIWRGRADCDFFLGQPVGKTSRVQLTIGNAKIKPWEDRIAFGL